MKLYRNAIILVIIVALLVGAYFLIDSNKGKDDGITDTPSDTVKLTDYTSDEIASCTLINQDGEFVIVKKDEEWALSKPDDIKADPSTLSSIVINASSVAASKIVEEDAQDLSVYGLDKPIIVKVKPKEGDEIVIEIGNETPTESGYYAKLSGDDSVYVIGTYTANKLVVGRNDIRTKKIYDVAVEDISGLSMDRKGQNVFESVMESENNWSMTRPIKGSMNATALSVMLDAIVNTTANKFIEENPSSLSAYGLDEPDYALSFKTAGNKTYKLLIGDEVSGGGEMYAKLDSGNDVFTINTSVFTFLDKPLKEIVEVFAYIVNIDQVKEIDLTMDGKTTHMTLDIYKDEEGKSDTDKDKFTVNGIDASGENEEGDQPFRKFYQSLIGISLDEIDVEGQPTGNPEISIEYKLNSGSMKVDFISKDNNYYYVVRNGEYAGILVKKNRYAFGILEMKEYYSKLMDFIK